jgi:hypothetical protein
MEMLSQPNSVGALKIQYLLILQKLDISVRQGAATPDRQSSRGIDMSKRSLAVLTIFAVFAALAALIAAGPAGAQAPAGVASSPINTGPAILPAGPFHTNMPMLAGPGPAGGAPGVNMPLLSGPPASSRAGWPAVGPGPRRFGVPLGRSGQAPGRQNRGNGSAPAPMFFRGVGR